MVKGMRLWSSNKAINKPSSILAFPEDFTTQLRARRAARKPWAPPGNAIIKEVSAAAAAWVCMGWEGVLLVVFSVAGVGEVARAPSLAVLAGRIGEGGDGKVCCKVCCIPDEEAADKVWEGDAPSRTKRA
jgi:hypothetical protein